MEQTGGNKNITTMKKFKLIYALLAATLFVTACSDEELINEGRVPAADGSEIIFGGRAGFENNGNDFVFVIFKIFCNVEFIRVVSSLTIAYKFAVDI
jgi:hypothetical protein